MVLCFRVRTRDLFSILVFVHVYRFVPRRLSCLGGLRIVFSQGCRSEEEVDEGGAPHPPSLPHPNPVVDSSCTWNGNAVVLLHYFAIERNVAWTKNCARQTDIPVAYFAGIRYFRAGLSILIGTQSRLDSGRLCAFFVLVDSGYDLNRTGQGEVYS